MAEHESGAFVSAAAEGGRVQAARGRTTSAVVAAGGLDGRQASSRAPAVSMQVPQQAPTPVRIVSSGNELQPASAAARMSWSVIPLQMQTYKVVGQWRRAGRYCATT